MCAHWYSCKNPLNHIPPTSKFSWLGYNQDTRQPFVNRIQTNNLPSDLAVPPPPTNCCLANFTDDLWSWRMRGAYTRLFPNQRKFIQLCFSHLSWSCRIDKVDPKSRSRYTVARSHTATQHSWLLSRILAPSHTCNVRLQGHPARYCSGQNYPTKASQFDEPRSKILNLTNFNEGCSDDSLKVTSGIGVGSHTGV